MALSPSLGITCSPVRNFLDQKPFFFRPYGSSTATNVLQFFLGTPDITNDVSPVLIILLIPKIYCVTYLLIIQVLFLGSGDLRNALFTGAMLTEAYPELNIHMNDVFDLTVARNFLLINILLDEDFDPDVESDIQYLWDVWYSTQWTETTRARFVEGNLFL